MRTRKVNRYFSANREMSYLSGIIETNCLIITRCDKLLAGWRIVDVDDS